MISQIRRRTGECVDFELVKIQKAIFGAAQEVERGDQAFAKALSEEVFKLLHEKFGAAIPGVEDIQDTVEEVLIKNGEVAVSRAFIVYRERRKQERKEHYQDILTKMKKHEIMVKHSDGSSEMFDMSKILQSVQSAADGLKKVNKELIVMDACKSLYPGVSVREIETAVINSAKGKIERHPEYSFVSARLLLQQMYKEVFASSGKHDFKEVSKKYISDFSDYLQKGVDFEILSPELQTFDLKKIEAALCPERDFLFQFLGAQTFYDRYLLKDRASVQSIFELPQWLWMRVAMGLALSEKKEDREDRAIEFYNVLSQFLFISSTPTLFNSGTTHSQMSSCYLNTVEDSITGIFKSYADNAQLSKWAGGIGTDWTPVRSKNARIHGTNGSSQGVIPFLKIFNDTALAVNQGGKRKGAMCAYLEVWHGDVEEFLDARKNTGDERRRLHDVNTALWIPDLFMKRVQENGMWTLFSPADVPGLHDAYGKDFEEMYVKYENEKLDLSRQIEAKTLWRKMLTMLYETGHPWITFKDPANVRNPQSHVGVIHNSNLCTEIMLNTSKEETAVCNLGSVNLSRMIIDKKLNEALIKKTVATGMRMLDNVVDTNFYPIPEAEYSNKKHRPIGLGMMGYQEALYQMDISFESQENLQFADESMEMISYYSIFASSQIAKEKGSYSSFPGSKWDQGILPYDTVDLYENSRNVPVICNRQQKLDWSIVKDHIAEHGMRNALCMAIAPTATISNIAGTTPCTEPTYKNIYIKENLSGKFTLINPYLVQDLEDLGLWTENIMNKLKFYDGSVQDITEIPDHIKSKYKETFEVAPEWIIHAAARRGKWIDQAASTNIFLSTTSGKILNDTYMLAWKVGLKTTYYLRSLAVSQVEKMVQIDEDKPAVVAPKLTTAQLIAKMAEPDCESCQ